jgi:hypothetical protein
MPGNIFVLGDDGKLIEMRETPYDSEALLQRLLAVLVALDAKRRSFRFRRRARPRVLSPERC